MQKNEKKTFLDCVRKSLELSEGKKKRNDQKIREIIIKSF